MITIILRENLLVKYKDVSNLVFTKCMAAQYTIRATANMTLQHIPCELTFRDMILPVSRNIDWEDLFQRKQNIIS